MDVHTFETRMGWNNKISPKEILLCCEDWDPVR